MYQREQLEEYNEQDFTSPENYKIIAEIREFKKKLKGKDSIINDIKKKTEDLNSLLIGQDMKNALNLIGKKFKKMRKRLEDALEELNKVDKAGKEMDGNCSNTEEDEFINALKEEMPEVFKNIQANFV